MKRLLAFARWLLVGRPRGCACGRQVGRLYYGFWDQPVYCEYCVPFYLRRSYRPRG